MDKPVTVMDYLRARVIWFARTRYPDEDHAVWGHDTEEAGRIVRSVEDGLAAQQRRETNRTYYEVQSERSHSHPILKHGGAPSAEKAGAAFKAKRPPRAAQFSLLLIPKRSREHLLGDLEEEYRTIVLPQYGRFWAKLWYWEQTMLALGFYVWPFVKHVLGLAAIWKVIGR